MKKIFPLIAVLITLSLIGLIFFQYLWLKSAKDLRSQQMKMAAANAVGNVAARLITEKSPFVIPTKKNDLMLPGTRNIDIFNSSITSRFTADEIRSYLKSEFNKDANLKELPFEFAVVVPGAYAVEPM